MAHPLCQKERFRAVRHYGSRQRDPVRGLPRCPVEQETKDSPRRIDAAVAAVMAVHRAAELAGAPRLDIYI
jgi:hypothetical protein